MLHRFFLQGLLGERLGLTLITILVTSEVLVPPAVVYLTECHAGTYFFIFLFPLKFCEITIS